MGKNRLSRRDFLRVSAVAATGAAIAACAPATPQVVEVIKEVPVEKEVIKEVPVEKVVEKERVVTPTPAGKPVIRWQTWPNAEYQAAARAGAEIFMNDHPDIDMIVEPNPPGNKMEKLMASMVGGVSPDIFHYWGLWFAKLHQRGQLLDLQPFVDQAMTQEEIDDFVPKGWEIFGRLSFLPGKRLAMPKYFNFMWLWFSEDDLKAAGQDFPDIDWTLDDLAEAGKNLTQLNADGTVKKYGAGFNGLQVMERHFYNLERFGGYFVTHDEPAKCLMGSPEAQAGFEWLRARLFEDHTWLPRTVQLTIAGQPVVNGQVPLWETGELQFQHWRDVEGVRTINFFHPPIGPYERTSYLVTDGEGLWSGTKWPDAAWEVMKFLSGPVLQELWCRAGGVLPVRMSVVRKWPDIMVETVPNSEGANLNVPIDAFEMGYGRDDERFQCQAEAEEIINPLLEKVFVVGDAPVSVLADACPQVEAAQTCELA